MPGPHSSTPDAKITNAIDYPWPSPRSSGRTLPGLLYTHGGDDFYGVIRTSVLRKIKPSAASTGPIAPSLPSLALQGPFYNVPEFLYFRRDHPTGRPGR
jgi:hypothetical protein